MQQNRRMRGRNNNNGGGSNNNNGNNNNNNNNNRNRGGPNPLTRSYESNGPDVKIRGTAQNIAEKYLTLARDAQSSGDRVMAENYLQHAEHYNRIIAGALALQQQNQRDNREEEEDLSPVNGDNRFDDVKHAHPQPRQEQQEQPARMDEQPQPEMAVSFIGGAPQPVVEAQSFAENNADEQPRQNARQRQPRENSQPRENNRESAAPAAERPRTPRPRMPRPPREPRAEVAVESSDAPAEGGLLATLSRGADRPVPVTVDE